MKGRRSVQKGGGGIERRGTDNSIIIRVADCLTPGCLSTK